MMHFNFQWNKADSQWTWTGPLSFHAKIFFCGLNRSPVLHTCFKSHFPFPGRGYESHNLFPSLFLKRVRLEQLLQDFGVPNPSIPFQDNSQPPVPICSEGRTEG